MRATSPSLASLSLLCLAPSFVPLLPSEDEPYEEDITYLLDTFETKAGKILKQKKIDWKSVRREFSKAAKAVAGLGETCTGLILDFRSNRGGGYDRDALLGRFVPKGESWGNEESAGPAPFTGDLVVLIDPSTISAGETIVGELKEERRAYLIGPGGTHGASGSKEIAKVPSGLFEVRFVVRSNKMRFNGGKGVEGIGIAPHEIVAYDPKVLAQGIDPAIARAVEVLEDGIPKKAVSYVPPARR